MARTELALQVTTRAGITPTYSAATADGFAINNESGEVLLHVKNAGGSPTTVTIGSTKTIDGRVLPALTVSVPATTGDKIIGPFPLNLYNEVCATPAIEKAVLIGISPQTSVTIAAIKLGVNTY